MRGDGSAESIASRHRNKRAFSRSLLWSSLPLLLFASPMRVRYCVNANDTCAGDFRFSLNLTANRLVGLLPTTLTFLSASAMHLTSLDLSESRPQRGIVFGEADSFDPSTFDLGNWNTSAQSVCTQFPKHHRSGGQHYAAVWAIRGVCWV